MSRLHVYNSCNRLPHVLSVVFHTVSCIITAFRWWIISTFLVVYISYCTVGFFKTKSGSKQTSVKIFWNALGRERMRKVCIIKRNIKFIYSCKKLIHLYLVQSRCCQAICVNWKIMVRLEKVLMSDKGCWIQRRRYRIKKKITIRIEFCKELCWEEKQDKIILGNKNDRKIQRTSEHIAPAQPEPFLNIFQMHIMYKTMSFRVSPQKKSLKKYVRICI